MQETPEQIAKRIIESIRYITIASVSNNNIPWNSPVFSAHDKNLNFFWASDQNAQHSKNIKENNQVFLVIYDSTVQEGAGEGVYIQAKAYEIKDEKEVRNALKYLDGRVNKKSHTPNQFLGTMPRRVYKAISEQIWVNGDGNVNGNYIDIRIGVNLASLRINLTNQ